MKLSIKDYILGGIIAILLCFIIFKKSNSSPDQILIKHTQDSLQTEIFKKTDSIGLYSNRIISLEDSIKNIQNKIDHNDKDIKIIRQVYERKVKVIDDWDVDQLERFFSDRYNNSNNTQ